MAVGLGGPFTALANGTNGARALNHHAMVVNGEVVGSTFQIGDGIAVTNAHVVEGLRRGDRVAVETSMSPRRRTEAWVVAISDRMDLALLELPRGFLPIVPLAPPRRFAGAPVTAAGVDASGGRTGLPRMQLSGRIIAADAHVGAFGSGLIARVPGVKPGFSGGPMFDAGGRLLGMIAAIRPGPAGPAAHAAAGVAPPRDRPDEEAFVLGEAEIRAEARRLLAAAGR